ncbi:ornithine carbamoyltransferase [Salinibacillus kushneri]|uniref:Ornithine carbamoyltransferase n=1 Tax=Salinibacillus kushneri TaxID=237682 RepID=A0A1I0G9D6_9BACI|nr:ornithine carbamoyltransferase [Salinibacillus kushneri]SET66698.1 ornithine carbamoyltransferase [Salinibacillus kushneri]
MSSATSSATIESLKDRDFVTLKDFTKQEIASLLELAAKLKQQKKQGLPHQPLQGKTLGMVFEKSSTRTRVSFEAGIYQLGGVGLFLNTQDIQLGRGETIADTAKILSSYLDAIMIRTFNQSTVEQLAKHASIPVINGLTDLYHPCQVLADLLTMKEHKGNLEGLTLTYLGDGNNMAHSLMIGSAKMGMNVHIASPEEYKPLPEITIQAEQIAKENDGSIMITQDVEKAVQNSDIIYTDVWTSMGQEDEQAKRTEIFQTYRVNEELLKQAKPDAIFMHCLPAHRGEEVTTGVIDGNQSVVFEEAENRLHAQKALMVALMGNSFPQ